GKGEIQGFGRNRPFKPRGLRRYPSIGGRRLTPKLLSARSTREGSMPSFRPMAGRGVPSPYILLISKLRAQGCTFALKRKDQPCHPHNRQLSTFGACSLR